MTSKNVQMFSEVQLVVSLPSFEHFKAAINLFFTITWKKYKPNWLYFPLRKHASDVIFTVFTLIDNIYKPISVREF